MKVEIELDMDKIDYDAINAQIQEKIKAIDISKYDIDSKIDYLVNKNVTDLYRPYIDKDFYDSLTYVGKSKARDIANKKFEEIITGIIDDIYAKNDIDQIVRELFPELFVQALYNLLYNNIRNSVAKNEQNIINLAVSKMSSMIKK